MTLPIPRRGVYVLVLACAVAAAVLAYSLTRSAHRATAGAAPPAATAMAAMRNPSLVVKENPALLKRLPPGVEAAPGTVRELVSGLGSMNFAVYVWPHGHDGICMVSTHGGGGCLDRFWIPFDISISDFDRLGSGQPALVWGPVEDDVARVTVTVAGHAPQEAIVRNNVAFFEFPDAALLPSDVLRVTVTFRDGTTQNIRV